MLKLSGLTVHYGRVAALHDVSLDVKKGEFVAMVGANGAGKSTTLRTTMGLSRPSSGTIEFEGQSIARETPESIVRRGIALVPEGRQIFGSLTVAENLALGTTPRRDRHEASKHIEEVLDRFEILRTYYRSSADKLSGGEQQQLAIARALLSKPRLLLLDEPSLGLAPVMIDLVFDILKDLNESGVTIFLAEQNAVRGIELADRAYVLRTGRIATSGSREELLATTDFVAAYLGG